MEGKAALFKPFAGVDAWPVCLDTTDTEEIIRTVKLIAPVYGGINLEDISAPRCFEIERRLRDSWTSPSSTTTSTARPSACSPPSATRSRSSARTSPTAGSSCRESGRRAARSSGCCSTAARATSSRSTSTGSSIPTALVWTRTSPRSPARPTGPASTAGSTRPCRAPTCSSASPPPASLTEAHLASMADRPDRLRTREPGARGRTPPRPPVCVGRRHRPVGPPEPDQQRPRLPGRVPGSARPGATEVTDAMLLAAADALADVVDPAQRSATYVIPSVFDPRVAPAVASAIAPPSSTTPREVLARVS